MHLSLIISRGKTLFSSSNSCLSNRSPVSQLGGKVRGVVPVTIAEENYSRQMFVPILCVRRFNN